MSRRQHNEISVFSTSFLDLLSCGMGAVIILLIIFLSRIEVASSDATSFAMVTVTVEYASPELVGSLDERLYIGTKEVVRPSSVGQLEQLDQSGNWHAISDTQSFSGPCGQVNSCRECIVSSSARQAARSPIVVGVPFRLIPTTGNPDSNSLPVILTFRRTYTVVLKDMQGDERVRLTIRRRPFPPKGSTPNASGYEDLDRSASYFSQDARTRHGDVVPPRPYPSGSDWISAVFDGGGNATNLPARISCHVHSSSTPQDAATAARLHLDQLEVQKDDSLVKASELHLDVVIDQDLSLPNPIAVHGRGP